MVDAKTFYSIGLFPEGHHLLGEGFDRGPDGLDQCMAGLRVTQEAFDAVAVEDAKVDGDGYEDEKPEAVTPFQVFVTLANKN